MHYRLIALFTVSLVTSLFLGACSANDPPVPKIISPMAVNVSMFDTVRVKYDVELEQLEAKNISIKPAGAKWRFAPDHKSILIWGASSWPEKNRDTTFSAFQSSTIYTVTLTNILSTEGRIQKGDQEVEIDVLPMIDTDFDDGEETNGNWVGADPLYVDGKFSANGRKWGQTEFFSGMLAGDFVSKASDLRDWYALDLTRDELRLKIELLSPRAPELALHFYGPVPADESSSDNFELWPSNKAALPKAKNVQTLDFSISVDRHLTGLADGKAVDMAARYFILVTYQNVSVASPAIPYRLSIGPGSESVK